MQIDDKVRLMVPGFRDINGIAHYGEISMGAIGTVRYIQKIHRPYRRPVYDDMLYGRFVPSEPTCIYDEEEEYALVRFDFYPMKDRSTSMAGYRVEYWINIRDLCVVKTNMEIDYYGYKIKVEKEHEEYNKKIKKLLDMELKVGDRVRGYCGSSYEGTVFFIHSSERRATIKRDDCFSGSGEYIPEIGKHGWDIRKKPDGLWGADGEAGTLEVISSNEAAGEQKRKFKAGDKVRIKETCCGSKKGEIYALRQDGGENNLIASGGNLEPGCSGCRCTANWELISSSESINSENKKMTLKEKFILGLTKEPNRSFRKAGITNGDDILTEEGVTVFLSYLLHSKYAEEFKKDVVDGILEEQEKEAKNK